jgi:hypothetical protein
MSELKTKNHAINLHNDSLNEHNKCLKAENS